MDSDNRRYVISVFFVGSALLALPGALPFGFFPGSFPAKGFLSGGFPPGSFFFGSFPSEGFLFEGLSLSKTGFFFGGFFFRGQEQFSCASRRVCLVHCLRSFPLGDFLFKGFSEAGFFFLSFFFGGQEQFSCGLLRI